jgi:pilus assembly protein CpaB
MMRKSGSIFLLALVIGALTSALVYRRLRAQQRDIEAARRAGEETAVELVVAKGQIPIGARITEEHVRRVAWPVDAQPEGAVVEPAAAVGRMARTTIEKNQPILQSHLAKDGVGLLPMMIADGMRAMSVKVDNVTGVSGFITPHSRVDVLVAGKPPGDGDDEEYSKLILQNIKVLATGTSIEQQDNKPVEVPTVTLLVTPEDAETLTLASRYQPVRLVLRNYRDEELVDTPGKAAVALFKVHQQRHEVAAGSAPAPRYSVEVLLGEKSTRQDVF